MKIIEEKLNGLKLIEFNIFSDDRGFFCERFNTNKFADIGLPINFVQDNHSFSKKGVIRGLHYQKDPNQAKLVGCISGEIFDVAVDIRTNSKTFGEYYGVNLSAENGRMLYIPAGFAHGFSVLSEEGANVIYKVDGLYNPKGENGITYNDGEININWKVKNPIVSERDLNLQSFDDYKSNPDF